MSPRPIVDTGRPPRRRRRSRQVVAAAAVGAVGLLVAVSCGADEPPRASPDGSALVPGSTPTRLLPCQASATFSYASLPGVDPNLLSLDVYTPPDDGSGCGDRPMVVWIHGGGWTSGAVSYTHLTLPTNREV